MRVGRARPDWLKARRHAEATFASLPVLGEQMSLTLT